MGLVGGLIAMAAVGGLLLAAAGVRGTEPKPPREVTAGRSGGPDRLGLRLLAAVGGAASLLFLTGWPVLAFWGAVLGFVGPDVLAAKRKRKARVELVEAIAGFAETLRDLTSAGSGIQEAIRLAARVAPEAIADEVKELAVRLERENPQLVLARFADALRTPECDLVVHALLVAIGRQGGAVAETLTGAAESARDRAKMLRAVEAGRSRTSSEAKTVCAISVAMVAFYVAGGERLVGPYSGVGGQIALAIISLVFAGSALKMFRLTADRPSPRVVSSMVATVQAGAGVGDEQAHAGAGAGVEGQGSAR